ncbi:biotin--[acetyl-CoA-carboxylase] ligase [Salinimicrobium soli]|uniref:biotin--[acetyl-CoA-carboxylase] ligase n=1 Tax=Salinimicrobium soli TaxID=1254399 RepID=UPI003AACE64B
MHLIKVNAINSTNSFAREMFRDNPGMSATCVIAKKQLLGRGQRGTTWDSEEGKNLTFSVIFPKPQILPGSQFVLSAAVATSLVKALEKFDLPKLKVKWPNDIMSANLKIGGILIENVISEGKVAATVIGVGLNVNQEEFIGLPGAGSMNSVSGKYFDLDKVLDQLLEVLEESLYALNSCSSEAVLKEYKKHLFRMQIPSTFQLPDESYFTGMIADVTPAGKLLVKTEDELLQEYDLKEIRLCY